MTTRRKHRLGDCNPRWVEAPDGGPRCYVRFECPEGHPECWHTVPFSPSLGGAVVVHAGAKWDRTGDTFETLTLTPSIRRIPFHASREAAIAAGCIPKYISESLLCAFHGYIKNGAIEFCKDSK